MASPADNAGGAAGSRPTRRAIRRGEFPAIELQKEIAVLLPIEVVAGKPQRILSACTQQLRMVDHTFHRLRERLQVGAVIDQSDVGLFHPDRT